MKNASADDPRSVASGSGPDNGQHRDVELVAALRAGDPRAPAALVDAYEPYVERLVAGVLGVDSELADVVQDVFLLVLERVHQLRDAAALRGWIGSLAIFTARKVIRRRRRWRWIRFLAPRALPEIPAPAPSPEDEQILRSTYEVLDRLPDEEREALALRFISELELTEVAAACRVSLATIKRRLARAEERFRQEMEGGPRPRPARSRRDDSIRGVR